MDLQHVRLTVVDSKGRRVRTYQDELTFEVEGDAKIVAVTNGDINSDELNAEKKSFFAGGLAAVKVEWVPTRHLSLFAAPSYTIPVKMGQIATSLDTNDKSVTKAAGGFKLSVGINLIF